MITMRDLDWQFGISNLSGDFNRNFFDWDRRICSKNCCRKIEIRKIGNIFAINYSEKSRDQKSSSKNPVVSKTWRSNYRVSAVHIMNRAVNLAETSTVFAKLFDQVSDIGPSWSSCSFFIFPFPLFSES